MSLVINFLTGAPRVPAPVTPDPPAKGDGHFGNLLSDLWEREDQASGFLGEAAPTIGEEQQGVSNGVADVFNQHGLLAKDVDMTTPDVASIAPASLPIAGISMASQGDAAPNDPAPVSPVATAGPIASNILPRVEEIALPVPPMGPESFALASSRTVGAQPVVMEAAPVAVSQRVAALASSARPPVPTAVRGFSIVDANVGDLEDFQPGQSQSSRRDTPDGGAISDAQLTLHMAELGATIVGRAVDGGQPGRAKLRDRITALLSRYGIRARDVRLNGAVLSNATEPRNEEL